MRSRSTGLLSEISEPERALRTDNASFPTIMNRDATTVGSDANAVADAADTNAWATT